MQDLFSCRMQTLSCSMWDLVPRPAIEHGPPALGAQSLSHWATREVHEHPSNRTVFQYSHA